MASVRNATLSCKDLKDVKHNIDELKNSATDQFYHFYKKLKANQSNFYQEINVLIKNMNQVQSSDIEQLNDFQKDLYQEEIKEIYELFTPNKELEINISTLLNLIRQINNSNEAVIRAFNHLNLQKVV